MKKILDGYENQRVNYRRQKGSKYHPARSCRDLQLDSITSVESGRFVMPWIRATLQSDLTSTLIRHENGAFQERPSNQRNSKTAPLPFSVIGKYFEI